MTDWQMYLWFGLKQTNDRLNWFLYDDPAGYLADDGFGNLLSVADVYFAE